MESNIVEYLRQNKDKYEKDDLVAELKRSGYKDEDIAEGIMNVYGERIGKIEGHILESKPEIKAGSKVLEFLGGFFAFVLYYLLSLALEMTFAEAFPFATLLLLAAFFVIGFIWIKRRFRDGRRYFALGLVTASVLPFLLSGGCFIILLGNAF